MRGRWKEEKYLRDGIRGLPSFLLLLQLYIVRLDPMYLVQGFSYSPIRFVAAEAGFLPSVPLILFADMLGVCYLFTEDCVDARGFSEANFFQESQIE